MSRKSEYEEYIRSDHWRALRKSKLDTSDRLCAICRKNGVLHVHHIRYRNLTDCVLSDLLILCKDCHDELHYAEDILKVSVIDLELDEIKVVLKLVRTHRKHPRWKQRRTAPVSTQAAPDDREKIQGIECRNQYQRDLMNLPWFGGVWFMERKHFKREVKKHFKGVPNKSRWIANALVLWDRVASRNGMTNLVNVIGEFSADPF